MLSGITLPQIPSLFTHIPSDSIVLYVRNPVNLIEIMNQKELTTQQLSGIDISEKIRELMRTFFELEKFDQIEKNLKHEMEFQQMALCRICLVWHLHDRFQEGLLRSFYVFRNSTCV